MATLQETVRADMVAAMKAKDAERLSVLRGLLTLFTQELTATKRTPQDTLSDDEVLTLIKRSVKQRKEAASQFTAGKREDLAEKEVAEAAILATYLPLQATEEEIEAVVRAKVEALGHVEASSIGKLTGLVMAEFKGTADGALVRSVITRVLGV